MTLIEHYKAALERVVFVHADAPEVPAADLAEIAGEALDTAPPDTTEGAVAECERLRLIAETQGAEIDRLREVLSARPSVTGRDFYEDGVFVPSRALAKIEELHIECGIAQGNVTALRQQLEGAVKRAETAEAEVARLAGLLDAAVRDAAMWHGTARALVEELDRGSDDRQP